MDATIVMYTYCNVSTVDRSFYGICRSHRDTGILNPSESNQLHAAIKVASRCALVIPNLTWSQYQISTGELTCVRSILRIEDHIRHTCNSGDATDLCTDAASDVPVRDRL